MEENTISITIRAKTGSEARELMRSLLGGGEQPATLKTDDGVGGLDQVLPETAEPQEIEQTEGNPALPQHLIDAGYDPENISAADAQEHFDLLTEARELGCKRIGVKSQIDTLKEKIHEAKGSKGEPDAEPEVLNLEQAKEAYGAQEAVSDKKPEPEPEKDITKEDVREALLETMTAGVGDSAVEVLTKHGAVNAKGEPGMSYVTDETAPAVYRDLKALLASNKSASEDIEV